jgi:hypothetical protein
MLSALILLLPEDISVTPWQFKNGFRSRRLQYCISGMIGSITCTTIASEVSPPYRGAHLLLWL